MKKHENFTNMDAYGMVALMRPSGLTFQQMNNVLDDCNLSEYKTKNISNLIRYSDSKELTQKKGNKKKYTFSAKNSKRLIHCNGLFYPNYQYFLSNEKFRNICIQHINLFPQPEKDNQGFYDLTTNLILLSKITNKDIWTEICFNASNDIKIMMRAYNEINLKPTPKQISELLSHIFANQFAIVFTKYGIHTESPEIDDLPDLIIDYDKKSEIKVSKGSNTNDGNINWRGGNFSKRYGSYFMISWNWINDTDINVFVSYVYLSKDNWNYRDNYYGCTIQINELFSDFNPYIIIGDITMSKMKKARAVYHNITPTLHQTIDLPQSILDSMTIYPIELETENKPCTALVKYTPFNLTPQGHFPILF